MQFSSLSLAPSLLTALNEEGYTTPTPIQAQAIPPVLEGRDLLGCAQTGTGKTAAFALPILHRLLTAPADPARRGPALPRALILSPTRELATQIGESFRTYGRHTGLNHTVIFGGVSQFHQVRALHRGVDILVATPGRLIDLMEQRLVNLSAVSVFVLDEADRMLDMGFINPIRKIAAAVTGPRQTLLFSATMPREITHLAESLMRNPVRVAVTPVASAAPKIEQALFMVQRVHKPSLLLHLMKDASISRVVVFTRTKHGADRVAKKLHLSGVEAEAIHGDKAQNQRTRSLDRFRSGRARVLVATDVAARGLDVDGITHVINYDMPNEPEAYVHRIGRTGRAGASGIAISFCDHEERDELRAIERLTGKRIPVSNLPELPAPEPKAMMDARQDSRPEMGRDYSQPRQRSGYESREGGDKPRQQSGGHDLRGMHQRRARQSGPGASQRAPREDGRASAGHGNGSSHGNSRSRGTPMNGQHSGGQNSGQNGGGHHGGGNASRPRHWNPTRRTSGGKR